MGKRGRKFFTLLGIAVLVLGMAAPLWAAEKSSPSYMEGALHKLGRGVANIVSCPAELIRTPELVGRKEGYVSALSTGLLLGAWQTIVRGLAGVVETVTFFVEIPKGFKPILQPEFVYADGDWLE